MRVLMLGWEFPPFISGGLGTACYGLTRALSRKQAQVIFVLPRDPNAEVTTHVRLLAATPEGARRAGVDPFLIDSASILNDPLLASVRMHAVPSRVVSPYQSVGGKVYASVEYGRRGAGASPGGGGGQAGATGFAVPASAHEPMSVLQSSAAPTGGRDYEGDLIAETQRYAAMCVQIAQHEQFDVIHAHDWLTYPAGLAVAAVSGKPLVVHVHSTEFDRSGDNVNARVYEIERRGMHGACRVICVSHLTRSVVQHRYGVNPTKIDVVYNGVENGTVNTSYKPHAGISRGDKIVLFLGRITMQKGPEYFVGAAKKVLEKYDRVKFVMAGTGDKIRDVIELAASEGIGHKVLFTGFLHRKDVERVFRMADVYVMPSVSEPFGIAPLEAISNDVPVIISKTSGVAEVLTHALKVDFWDTHEIANKILAVLRHPPLSNTLREHADMEVRQLTWDGAAMKCLETYRRSVEMVGA